jgi:hypothetical protein
LILTEKKRRLVGAEKREDIDGDLGSGKIGIWGMASSERLWFWFKAAAA